MGGNWAWFSCDVTSQGIKRQSREIPKKDGFALMLARKRGIFLDLVKIDLSIVISLTAPRLNENKNEGREISRSRAKLE